MTEHCQLGVGVYTDQQLSESTLIIIDLNKILIITIGTATAAEKWGYWVEYAAEEMVGDICHLCLASTL